MSFSRRSTEKIKKYWEQVFKYDKGLEYVTINWITISKHKKNKNIKRN